MIDEAPEWRKHFVPHLVFMVVFDYPPTNSHGTSQGVSWNAILLFRGPPNVSFLVSGWKGSRVNLETVATAT